MAATLYINHQLETDKKERGQHQENSDFKSLYSRIIWRISFITGHVAIAHSLRKQKEFSVSLNAVLKV